VENATARPVQTGRAIAVVSDAGRWLIFLC
jgi:hypothetical protein